MQVDHTTPNDSEDIPFDALQLPAEGDSLVYGDDEPKGYFMELKATILAETGEEDT